MKRTRSQQFVQCEQLKLTKCEKKSPEPDNSDLTEGEEG